MVQGHARQFKDPSPLANRWLTKLRASGVDAQSFADCTGTLSELEA